MPLDFYNSYLLFCLHKYFLLAFFLCFILGNLLFPCAGAGDSARAWVPYFVQSPCAALAFLALRDSTLFCLESTVRLNFVVTQAEFDDVIPFSLLLSYSSWHLLRRCLFEVGNLLICIFIIALYLLFCQKSIPLLTYKGLQSRLCHFFFQ